MIFIVLSLHTFFPVPVLVGPSDSSQKQLFELSKNLLETACATRYNYNGVKHPDYVATCYNLSEVYRLSGDEERAERIRRY